MSIVEQYLNAATRANTRRSYQAAVRHFEVEWGGFLPASADSVARYLAAHAETLSINTLRQRLAALARWHLDQGFPDPTKAPVVRKVLRGIRALHPAREKQAKPLQIAQLEQAVAWLDAAAIAAGEAGDRTAMLRTGRDKALLLLGFWRGFRGDELIRLEAQHVEVVPEEGLTCYFAHTKGDRHYRGATYKAPALLRLCPVEAYLAWVNLAHIDTGPVFRGIDRWGRVAASALHADSIAPMLRKVLKDAGVAAPELYSGHSLRRGFATWAGANGWDVSTLMRYVGWKDMHSAMRYVEAQDTFARRRVNAALTASDA